jgi:hypothetical protein
LYFPSLILISPIYTHLSCHRFFHMEHEEIAVKTSNYHCSPHSIISKHFKPSG